MQGVLRLKPNAIESKRVEVFSVLRTVGKPDKGLTSAHSVRHLRYPVCCTSIVGFPIQNILVQLVYEGSIVQVFAEAIAELLRSNEAIGDINHFRTF